MAILLGSIANTTAFPVGNKALAYKSKLNQAASIANACGNGELESTTVLCQNLLSQLQGKGNAVNTIGLQTSDSGGGGSGDRTTQPSQPHMGSATRTVESTLTPLVPDTWSSWQSLGGAIRSGTNPVAVFNTFSDNRLMVFAVGTDNALHFIQQTDVPDVNFFDWDQGHPIGGVVRANSDPAVIINSGGRLEAFVVGTDNAVWHTSQESPGSISFSSYQSLGGGVDPNTSPAVERNSDGRLELFVVGTDNALWHRSQTAPGSNTWSNWQSLGGILRDNTDPAVARNADGRLQVFVVGTPNGLYYRTQTSAGSNTWSAYQSLGGQVDLNTSPSAIRNLDGRLEMFVLGTDNALWHMAQTAAGSNVWSNWQFLGGALRDNSDPAVIMNPDGRLQVFVVASSSALLYKFQNSPGSFSNWSPYASLGGIVRINSSPTSACSELALGGGLSDSCTFSPLQVFVAGTDNALWHSWRTGL
jgi:hypothetical protein